MGKFSVAFDKAAKDFDGKYWTSAAVGYIDSERLALAIDEEGLAAESAYNAAVSFKNKKKDWSRARAMLKKNINKIS